MVRRFGPTLGAGVAVEEGDTEKPIELATLGVTAFTGILERGPLGKLFLVKTKTDFLRLAGSYIPESQVAHAAFDFYNLGNNAGELWLQRVTDGTEKKASVTLRSRGFPRKDVLKVEAENGGRWAGKKATVVGTYTAVTQTTLSTGKTMLKNELKGAIVKLSAVPGKSYKVLSNSVAGVLTFASDTTLVTDINGSTNELYVVELANAGKAVSVVLFDGVADPLNEFGLDVYVDGVFRKRYENLSMDPDSVNYVERVINDDSGNPDIKVTNLNTGSVTAAVRPANFYGKIKTVAALVLTADIHEVQTSSPGGAVATLASTTYGGSIKRQKLTLTCTTASPGAAEFSAVSDLQGALDDVTEGVAYLWNEFGMAFTLGHSGATEFAVGDVVVVEIDPFPVNGFVGFDLTPDEVNDRRTKFKIDSNTVNTITVKSGSDLTTVGATNDEWLVSAPTELGGGYDGIEDVVDATYQQAYDTSSTVLKQLFGKNKGFVKLATPGITATAVQKAGLACAESLNYGYRVEIPANIVTEQAAEAYVNSTLGRSDFGKLHFPSYGYVSNPLGAGQILQTLTGAILGREALTAKNFQGYHKAAGGIDMTLPNVISLPTGEKVLDEEFLNPVGINVVKFRRGTCIMWGGRSISVDSGFKFATHREQLSHYENIFRESFDYIIHAINTPSLRPPLIVAFREFFRPEFGRNAIRGRDLEDAVLIKVDDEINPPGAIATGDLFAQVKPRLADMVERFTIRISKAGIFEDLSA